MAKISERLAKLEEGLKKIESALKADDSKPPFTINSLLNLCWGFSLTLSKDPNQQKVGEKFFDAMLELWKKNSPEKPDPAAPLTKGQQNRLFFVQNLIASITGAVKNVGFAIESHDNYHAELEERYKGKVAWYDEISSLSSLKKEGLAAKIATFVGGGSITTIAKNINELFSNSKVKFDNLIALMDLTNDTSKKAEIFKKLETITEQNVPTFSGFEVLLFILSGIGLTLLMTFIVRYIREDRLDKARDDKKQKMLDYWFHEFKPEAAGYIFNFYKDVLALLHIHYKNHAEQMKRDFTREITGDENSELTDRQIKQHILENVLPQLWTFIKNDDDFKKIHDEEEARIGEIERMRAEEEERQKRER